MAEFTREEVITILDSSPIRDLSGVDLSGLDLSGSYLDDVNFSKANLSGTNLRNADLGGSFFGGADLSDAILESTSLINSIMFDANRAGTFLSGVDHGAKKIREMLRSGENLSHFDLRNLDLSNEDFTDIHMSKWDDANLSNTNLSGIRASRTDWRNVYVREADFTDADLSGADFSGVDLTGVSFINSSLEKAIFSGALLKNTLFRKAMLNKARFSIFVYSEPESLNWRGAPDTRPKWASNINRHGGSRGFFGYWGLSKPNTIKLIEILYSDQNFSAFNTEDDLKYGDGLYDLTPGKLLEEVNSSRSLHGNTFWEFLPTDLRATDFSGADLSQAVFLLSDMRGAKFHGADCGGTYFYSVNRDEADHLKQELPLLKLSETSLDEETYDELWDSIDDVSANRTMVELELILFRVLKPWEADGVQQKIGP